MNPVLRWLIGPEPIVRDLWLMAGSADAEQRLHEHLDWRAQRATAVAKGTLGTSVSFVVSLLVAQFKAELHINSWLVAGAVGGAVAIGIPGVYVLNRVARLQAGYPVYLLALRLLAP